MKGPSAAGFGVGWGEGGQASVPRGKDPAARFRGFSWGNVVHGALAFAAEGHDRDELRGAFRDLLVEHGRPVDDHGEPLELLELLRLVDRVRGSDLWSRAARASRCLIEIPVALREGAEHDGSM